MEKTFITPKELASRWGISLQTIYNTISTGRDLPRSIKIGGQRRFHISAVEEWEAARTVETVVS